MNRPKTIHVWMPDRRSLCDLRSRPFRATPIEDLSEPEFAQTKKDETSAPICGACLVLAGQIRARSAILLAEALHNKRGIYPPVPADVYPELRTTRWAKELNLTDTPPPELSDASYYYTQLTSPIDEEWLQSEAEREAAEDAEIWAKLGARRHEAPTPAE
ncbi:hypothetical protein BOH72_23435 [Mycobacterium sp. WY10]|nr:hypothetical protein BOH72_23435 [Mycobacterium sp. WY10]